MIRRAAAVVLGTIAFLIPANAAFAHNCYNASRTAASLSSNPADFSAPVTKGRWVWLPSVGVPLAAWAFDPPANYQNGTEDSWLLSNTPYCDAGGVVNPGATNRTYDHGIQSGCGNFG